MKLNCRPAPSRAARRWNRHRWMSFWCACSNGSMTWCARYRSMYQMGSVSGGQFRRKRAYHQPFPEGKTSGCNGCISRVWTWPRDEHPIITTREIKITDSQLRNAPIGATDDLLLHVFHQILPGGVNQKWNKYHNPSDNESRLYCQHWFID
jgi:hypothetical protein